jgi:hypothetical protein
MTPRAVTWPFQQQHSTRSTATNSATQLRCIVGKITMEGRLPPPSIRKPTQNALRTICNLVLELNRGDPLVLMQVYVSPQDSRPFKPFNARCKYMYHLF